MKKILLIILLVVPCRASEPLSQLISEARVLAIDPAGSRQRFADSQITAFINAGQRQALALSKQSGNCLQQSITFQLTPGTTFYPLPGNFLAVRRVAIGQKWIQEISPAGLDGRSRGWESASGYPNYYFINFSSRGLIGFAPWPAAGTDTDTVKVEFNVQPTDLSSGTDLPFGGIGELQDYHHALAYYAASLMETITGLPTQAQAYMGVFQGAVKMMVDRCIDRPNYMPSATGTP